MRPPAANKHEILNPKPEMQIWLPDPGRRLDRLARKTGIYGFALQGRTRHSASMGQRFGDELVAPTLGDTTLI